MVSAFLFSFGSPLFLLADPSVLESSGNTLTVDSFANATTAQIPVALPEVVVTANRLDTPVSQVPNSITVISAQDLEKRQLGTAMEALKDVPGLDMAQTGGPGEITSIYMRGSNDGNTLVMIDGIPLNDPSGTSRSYDFLDQLSLDGISRIEVVRGPQSTLYGSNATAGVINLITPEGAGPAGGSALFEGGSYGTFREAASAQGGDSKNYYSLSTSYFNTAGFPSADKSFGNIINNPDSDFSGVLRLGTAPVTNLHGDLLVRFGQARTSIDDGGGPGMDDPNNWVNQKQFLVGSKTRLTLNDWTQFLTVSFVDDDRDYSDLYDPTYFNSYSSFTTYDGQTAQVTWQNDVRLSREEYFVFGLQGSREWGNSTSDYGAGPSTVLISQWMGSSFLQSQTNINEKLFVNLGGRIDDYNTYGTHGTYQAGVAYFLPELNTKLKATYGTGFTAPTLYQLYAPANSGATINQGNPNLQPENSTGYDLGFEQPLGKSFATLGATYFHNEFDNLIASVGPYPNSQYQNSRNFQTQGVETYFNFKKVQDLVIQASYTYTDIQTDVPTTNDASPLLQKPTDQAGLDVDYHSGAVEAGATATYVGARPDFNFSTYPYSPVTLSEYYLVNVRASYQINTQLKLFARVDNLFNEYYEEVYGYGTPGLSAYVGTKISF